MNKRLQRLHRNLYFPLLFLFASALAMTGLSKFTGKSLQTGFYLYSAGIAVGWVSVLSGLVVLYSVRNRKLSMGFYWLHGFINTMSIMVLTAFWVNDWHHYPALRRQSVALFVLKILLVFLFVAGRTVAEWGSKKKQGRTNQVGLFVSTVKPA